MNAEAPGAVPIVRVRSRAEQSVSDHRCEFCRGRQPQPREVRAVGEGRVVDDGERALGPVPEQRQMAELTGQGSAQPERAVQPCLTEGRLWHGRGEVGAGEGGVACRGSPDAARAA